MGNSGSAEDIGSVLSSDGKTPRLYQCAERIRGDQWPIIYSPQYNIGFLGLEKIHPFDSGKWGKVYQFLVGV
jgi:histone deacetylase 11